VPPAAVLVAPLVIDPLVSLAVALAPSLAEEVLVTLAVVLLAPSVPSVPVAVVEPVSRLVVFVAGPTLPAAFESALSSDEHPRDGTLVKRSTSARLMVNRG
jgi:hypothetical protein